MRICLIGTFGHVGRAVSEMKNCSEAQFIGIAPGSTHEKIEALQRYALPVYEDYKAMLDTLKPDVAIVGPVFGLTGKIIMDCAARGIDVFSDKPVAGTLEELEQVEAAVRTSGIHFGAMHYLRFTPSFYHAKKMVKDGAVGTVKMLTAQKSYKYGTRPDWYHDRSLYVGTIPWVGIHAIDWIYYFAEHPFLSVSALQVDQPEKAALCQFRMGGGMIASANIDYLRPGAAPTHGDDRIRVAGTEGIMEVFEDHFVLINRDGVQEFRPTDAPKLAYDFLLGKEAMTMDEIFMITKTALLARESADTGHCICMEETK